MFHIRCLLIVVLCTLFCLFSIACMCVLFVVWLLFVVLGVRVLVLDCLTRVCWLFMFVCRKVFSLRSLFVVRWLFVCCSSLFVVICVVGCSLFVVGWCLFVMCCVLLVVCCNLCVACYVLLVFVSSSVFFCICLVSLWFLFLFDMQC